MKRLLKISSPVNTLSLLLAATLLAMILLPAAPTPARAAGLAPTAAKWYDGQIQYSTITNCFSIIQGVPYNEYGIGTYVGFLADTNVPQPSPNSPYYIHVVLAGMGRTCSGMRVYIDIGLPASTSLAISPTYPVYCLFDGVQIPANECNQSLQPSSYNAGFYNMRSVDAANLYTWPMPQGHTIEIQIPVVSSTTLTNSALVGRVWVLDGNASPWLQPQQGVYVFSSQPTFLYPSPATINITTTTARSQAHLFTHGIGGTGYFDLGATPSYELVWHEPITIPNGGNEFIAYDDWTPAPSGHLQPDTLYYWRFTYVPSSGAPVVGAAQTFRTLPDGRVTIGSGSAATCSGAAFTSALANAATKEIVFNCGSLPTTIVFSGAQSITHNLAINGGNKVVLSAGGSSNHFNVQSGATLTLTQLELANGAGACGGAVHVLGGALLSATQVRFTNNGASTGGAVCVDTTGQATITSSVFTGNHSTGQGGAIYNFGGLTLNQSTFTTNNANTHGGAIGNYATAVITDTNFTQNSAGINGGAIDTTVSLTVTRGVFTSNQSGVRGGAINNYLGTFTVGASRFINNRSSGYGGGIVNDAGTGTLLSSELSGNTAVSVGGGVRNSGGLTVTNSTLAYNNATGNGNTIPGNGGGFENAGTLALLNVTLAGNTSGGSGGNLYLNTSASSAVTLKNTLVAAGSPNNCDKAITSQGSNLESANTCGLNAAGDKISMDPRLGSLLFNRSLARTMALLPGSPAIDAANNTGCPVTDQRGFARPLDGDKNGSLVCDIGAFEYNSTLDLPKIYLPFLKR